MKILHRRFKWSVVMSNLEQYRLVRDIPIKEEDSHVAITHLIVLWKLPSGETRQFYYRWRTIRLPSIRDKQKCRKKEPW